MFLIHNGILGARKDYAGVQFFLLTNLAGLAADAGGRVYMFQARTDRRDIEVSREKFAFRRTSKTCYGCLCCVFALTA